MTVLLVENISFHKFYAQSPIPEKNRQHLRGYLFGEFCKCLMQKKQTLLENNKRLNSKVLKASKLKKVSLKYYLTLLFSHTRRHHFSWISPQIERNEIYTSPVSELFHISELLYSNAWHTLGF
ncbi:hypothetical protein T03_6497 [Trichinella britovi]|uniref:Uncharacterized protein n=1 Tax=Trichinella britovi TaxID=45882 RepID=A0A0V1CHP1_TRIBR|nr:hypothetical protein T03_6497 [Trichinella britovi]